MGGGGGGGSGMKVNCRVQGVHLDGKYIKLSGSNYNCTHFNIPAHT